MGIISFGPWGGPGGNRWSFKTDGGIAGITINFGDNIKSISFKDASGAVSGTFRGRNPNDWGEEIKIEFSWPLEKLKSVSGTYGHYKGLLVIMSLSLTTNFNSYGPFGTPTGEHFSVSIEDGDIVGFHGRCGHYLDALGIFVQPGDSSISLGPWGGSGGDPFIFKVAGWIREIIVHESGCINSIAFKNAIGDDCIKFGGRDPHDTGVKRTIEINGPSEYLTDIAGTYGYYKDHMVITSLSFTTNITTYGPFGTASGTSFSSMPAQGGVVAGFHGRDGYYIDAIGIHVKPLH
ncbi:mannose/glucose-specific lectin-like isoform X2 [Prosopis cineraria]|uniref:mannose/glucose-specific lectin-like isoform X2 n=1 Tax=Prosopis cineraria TaxID=364024 RepID=UPI0024103011|nr:mannose/glucose-specific lectin-like isoform X2 [Prosopis cineraria]